MWLVRVSVMLAVVQCASSAGGSPRLPTRMTPPLTWARASPTAPVTRTTAARAISAFRITTEASMPAPPASGSCVRWVDFARPAGLLSTDLRLVMRPRLALLPVVADGNVHRRRHLLRVRDRLPCVLLLRGEDLGEERILLCLRLERLVDALQLRAQHFVGRAHDLHAVLRGQLFGRLAVLVDRVCREPGDLGHRGVLDDRLQIGRQLRPLLAVHEQLVERGRLAEARHVVVLRRLLEPHDDVTARDRPPGAGYD